MMRRTFWSFLSLFLGALGAALLIFAVASAAPSASVSGFVRLVDGSPAAGAWVRVQTSDNLTFAAQEGSFTLSGLDEGVEATITAWYEGYKVGWATVTPPAEPFTITLQPYDTRDNSGYAWITSNADPSDPNGCGHCHQPTLDEWLNAAHAAGGTNPRFFSLYNGTDVTGTVGVPPGYLLDFPGTAGNCATCHAPGAAADAPFTTNMNALAGVEREGVFCDFCHKVGAVYLNPATGLPYNNAPGVLSMRLHRPFPGDQIFFGTLDDVMSQVSYLPLERKSQFCAPCHQFSFWGVPIYQSFKEWLESPYPALGIECQTCHMPPNGSPTFVLPEKGGLTRNPAILGSHLDLGVKDLAFMQSTVAMTMTAEQIGETIQVTLTLTNTGAGHHVPTDHPGRHLLLVVAAQDGQGVSLTQLSGPAVPSWGGEQAGLPGQAYAKVLQDVASGDYPVVSYWKQTRILSDNRLPALGSDTTTYVFAAPVGGGPVTVNARLIFRRLYQAEKDLRGWESPDILMQEIEDTLFSPSLRVLFLPMVIH